MHDNTAVEQCNKIFPTIPGTCCPAMVTDRIIEKRKSGKMPGLSPGNPQVGKKNKSGLLVPGYFPMPGKILSIIKCFYDSVCDCKTGVFPFFAGIANYRKPAAVKT